VVTIVRKRGVTMRVDPKLEKLVKDIKKDSDEKMTTITGQIAQFSLEKGFTVKKKRRVKKGSPLDLLVIMVTLLGFAMALIVGFTVYNSIAPSLNASSTAQQITANTYDQFGVWDNLFMAALIGLSLTSVISAAFVRTTPLFFVLSIFLLAMVLVVGAVIVNVWDDVSTSGAFSGVNSTFPKTFFLMDNLLLYLLVVGALIVIALYSVRGQSAI